MNQFSLFRDGQSSPCFLYQKLFKDILWITHGETYQEALNRGLDVMEDTIETMKKEGKPLPPVLGLQSA